MIVSRSAVFATLLATVLALASFALTTRVQAQTCSGNPANLFIPWSNDGSWTALPKGDDNSSSQITLPFNFTLYGVNYNRLFVNNNGNITFNAAYGEFSSSGFPSASVPPMVAPFWGDVDTRPAAAGQCWYKLIGTNTFVVTWVNVGYFNSQTNLLNTFQVVISDGTNPLLGPGNNCVFSYDTMCWTTGSASGGSGGFGGVPATVGANAGDGVGFFQIGRFDQNNNSYDGPSGNNDGVHYLDGQTFSIYVGSSNIPPIPSGFPDNNTASVAAGSTLNLPLQFLAPEAGQTVTVTYQDLNGAVARGLSITTTPGNTASVNLTWSPQCCDQGLYDIDLIATDNLGAISTVRLHINVTCAQVRPTASAGGPYNVECQGPVTVVQLDGTASADPDTAPANLTYQWSVSPSSFVITNPTSPTPMLAMPRATTGCTQSATVTLIVSDGTCSSRPSTAQVRVTDSVAPTIAAPSNVSVVGSVVGTQIQATPNIGEPVVVEACAGPASSTAQRSDFRPLASPFLLGITTINYTAFDSCNPSATAPQTVEVLAPPLPDLVFASTNVPSTGLTEEQFEVRWTVRNDGQAAPVQGWVDRVYLSTDDQVGSDTLLGTFNAPSLLAPGAQYTRAESLPFPVAPGTYWIVIKIDADSSVVELAGDANNTVVLGPITVLQAPKPDLTVVSVTPPSSGVVSGSTTEISFRVRNQGTGATSSAGWNDTVFLLPSSTFTSLNPAQVLAAPGNPQYLPAGDEYVSTISVQLPHDIEGQYYIAVYTDSQAGGGFNSPFRVRELNESNNFRVVGPFQITLENQPDLQVTSVTRPSVAFSDTEASISWVDTNVNGAPPRGGATDVGSWLDTIWLSLNNSPSITSGDIALTVSRGYSQTVTPGNAPLPAGQAVSASALVRIPHGLSGLYYVKINADANNRVSEFGFENNNVGVSAAPIDIRVSPPVDLIPTTVTGPSTASRGFEITVGWTAENDGAPPGAFPLNWTDNIYLSTNPTFDASDVLLGSSPRASSGSVGNITIPPYSVALTARVPTTITPGTYYLIVVVDAGNTVPEDAVGETNNALARVTPIVIDSRAADLTVAASGTPPTGGAAGSPLSLSWRVTNSGNVSTPVGTWTDRIVLASSPNGGGTQIADLAHSGALGTGGSYIASLNTTVPLVADGNYFLRIETDIGSSVFESDDSNNAVVIPFTVAGGAADLTVTSVSAPPTGVAGQSLAFSFTVQNIGQQGTLTGNWVDEVFLTPAAGGSALRVFARTRAATLASNGSYVVSGSFIIPQTLSGPYVLSGHTDTNNNVFETLENNNQASAANQTLISPGDTPNLAIGSIIAPSTGVSGQPLPLSITIDNRGTAAAPAPGAGGWRDSIYLSRDQFLDPATDIHLGTFDHSASVAAGSAYTITPAPTIPPGVAGPYFVIVRADSGNNVFEGGVEDDNTGASPQFVNIALPPPGDLSVASVTPPSTAVLGQPASYQWSILNSGTTTITSTWKDSLFLSTDPVWSINDKRVGTFTTSASGLIPSGTVAGSGTGSTPPVTPGSYYVVAKADVFNQVLETDDTNNTGTSAATVDVTAIPLLLGSPFTGAMASGEGLYFQLDTPAGETVRITFSHPSLGATTELFARFGTPPTTGEFDFVGDAPGTRAQEIVIPTTQGGRYYILAKVGGTAPSAPVNLLANILPFSVVSVGPSTAGNVGDATLRIRGARFTETTWAAVISSSGERTLASRVLFKDSATLMATFPLSGKAPGTYDVQVFEGREVLGQDPVTMTIGFMQEITAEARGVGLLSVASGGGPQLQIDYGLPAAARSGSNFPITIVVRNEGNNDLPAPIIGLQSPNATPLRLGSDPAGITDIEDIQLLVVGRESFLNILRPGESVVYRASALAVRVPDSLISAADLGSNVGEIPWDSFEEDLRLQDPGPQWNQTWANFKLLVGTTWSSYAQALRDVAMVAVTDPTKPITVANMVQALLAQASATLPPPPSLPRFGNRSGNPYADCSTRSGCTCPPNYTAADADSDRATVRRFGFFAGGYVPAAIELWLSGSGNFTGSGSWTYPGGSCSGNNCAARDIFSEGGITSKWAFVKSAVTSGISSNAEQIARSLSCGGSTHISLTDPRIGLTASQLNKIGINLAAGISGTALGRLVGQGSLSISGDAEVTLDCDRCTRCPRQLNIKLNLTLLVEDCYDYCPGNVPSVNLPFLDPEAFHRLEACSYASAGIQTTLSGTMNGIPLSPVSVSSSASSDPCCNPNRPPIRPPCGQTATDPCANCRRGQQVSGPRCPPPKPVPTVVSRDPNEKAGPVGYSVERWISSTNAIPYRIDFENVATASAPAATVTITDTLDAGLNPGTFRLGSIHIADREITVPDNLISWSGTVDLTATRGVLLHIDAGVDASTNPPKAFWVLQSIDPATGDPPTNGLLGFLPPNDSTGRGTGYVEFTIRPRRTIASGAVVRNKATIVFDNEAPLDTNEVLNTIDTEPPISIVSGAPAVSNGIIPISVAAQDAPNGSGLSDVQLFVSENNGPYRAFSSVDPAGGLQFEGQAGTVYRFATRAVDNAGNAEALPAGPQAVSVVPGIQLAAASDSGIAGDALTNVRTPTFNFVGIPDGPASVTVAGGLISRTVQATAGPLGQGEATIASADALPDGEYTATLNVGGVTTTTTFTVDGTPPSVQAIRSAVIHGGAGELPLAVTSNGLFVEGRAAGLHTLLVQFAAGEQVLGFDSSAVVQLSGLSLSNQPVALSGTVISVSPRGGGLYQATFTPPLPDGVRYCLKLRNVSDVAGNVIPDSATQVSFTTLKGDATGDRRVNNTDVGAINALVGTDPINPSNPNHVRADLNGDGRITSADVQIAVQARGRDARFIAEPCPAGLVAPVTYDEVLGATVHAGEGVNIRVGEVVMKLRELQVIDESLWQQATRKTSNARGDSIATIVDETGNERAMIRLADGSVSEIGTLGGPRSIATAINAAGQVVGYSDTAEGKVHAFRWSRTTGLEDLGVIDGATSMAFGLNEGGLVVGSSSNGAEVISPFLVNANRVMGALPGLGGQTGVGLDINESPMVIGSAGDASGAPKAISWSRETGTVNLNGLLPASSGWDLTSADALGEDGAIYGRGTYLGTAHAFRLGVGIEPWCRADVDRSGGVSVNDLFSYLSQFFANDPRADFNQSGNVSVQDLFVFLQEFFAGCN